MGTGTGSPTSVTGTVPFEITTVRRYGRYSSYPFLENKTLNIKKSDSMLQFEPILIFTISNTRIPCKR